MSQSISSFHHPNEDQWRDSDEAQRQNERYRLERESGYIPDLGPPTNWMRLRIEAMSQKPCPPANK